MASIQEQINEIKLLLSEHTLQIRLWNSVIEEHNERDAEIHKEVRDKLTAIDNELRNGLKFRLRELEVKWEHRERERTEKKTDWKWTITTIVALAAVVVAILALLK